MKGASFEQCEEIVKMARDIEGKSHVVKGVVNTKNWFEKMAEKADMELDDDIADLKKTLPTKKASVELQRKTDALKKMIVALDEQQLKQTDYV